MSHIICQIYPQILFVDICLGHGMSLTVFIHFDLDLRSQFLKLEDLKVLRRSPDLLNNVKIGQGQLQLIMEQILFYHI